MWFCSEKGVLWVMRDQTGDKYDLMFVCYVVTLDGAGIPTVLSDIYTKV